MVVEISFRAKFLQHKVVKSSLFSNKIGGMLTLAFLLLNTILELSVFIFIHGGFGCRWSSFAQVHPVLFPQKGFMML